MYQTALLLEEGLIGGNMFTNCANNPIYIPNGGECDDCSQLENRVDNLEEAMTEVQEELPDKQDKLTAGEGIFITPDGIISTTGSSIKVEITGNDPYYSSDKTFSEILTAYNNGDTIVANYQGTALSLQSISQTEAVFASTDSDGNLIFFTITNSNDISSKTVDSVFLVTLTNPVGESGNKTYTSDRTLAEILEAIRNGSNVYATYSVANYPSYLALDWYTNDIVWFSSMSVDNASQQISAASVAQNRDYVATYHSVIHGVMQGASATRNGWSGIVPQPFAGDEEKFLKGDGTWAEVSGLTHLMDGNANGSLRSNTAFPDGVIEQGGQSIDATLGNYATALGAETMATGMGAFAHGMMTMASGTCAHAEGAGTAATGGGSHSEGEQTVASGARSHAEGLSNTASGSESHVGGALSEASAAGAFAHGQGLKASSPLQTVFGKYNVEDSNSEYAFIIGNGTSNNRSNLFAIKWDGTVEINGQALLPANGNSF